MDEVDGVEAWDVDIDEERGKELRKSRRLDVHRWSDHTEVNTFVDFVFGECLTSALMGPNRVIY